MIFSKKLYFSIYMNEHHLKSMYDYVMYKVTYDYVMYKIMYDYETGMLSSYKIIKPQNMKHCMIFSNLLYKSICCGVHIWKYVF